MSDHNFIPIVEIGNTVTYHGSLSHRIKGTFKVENVLQDQPTYDVTEFTQRYELSQNGNTILWNVRRKSIALLFDPNETLEIEKAKAEVYGNS